MDNSSSEENIVSPGNSGTENENEEARATVIDLVKLRKLRKGLRLTQAELAALLGIHRTYLVLIEKGKKIPSPRLERQILDFMEKAEHDTLSPQSLWVQSRQPRVSGFGPEGRVQLSSSIFCRLYRDRIGHSPKRSNNALS